jgi:hypothetical protein
MTTKKGQMVASMAILTTSLVLMIGFPASPALHRNNRQAVAAELLRLNIPAVTHGFQKTAQLPDGDLFLLSKPMTMAVTDAPDGAQVFPVSVESFGGDAESIGALPTTAPQGLAFSTPNSKVRAITCSESIWDGNLLIASTPGSTDGDTVRLFLENPDGSEGPEVALFTVRNPGIDISKLHPHIMLFVNNRQAMGPSRHEGDFIPFSQVAGGSGYRTDLITLAWPMGSFSPLQGCFRVGVEITRGENEGRTSIVFTDIVVNRNRAPGDENNPGLGLLARLTGGYPTGFPCKAECPFPNLPDLPQPNPGGPGGGDECNAICFRSPQYFRLNLDHLPHGTVLVGGMNFNLPISTTDKRAMALALRGGFTPLQQLNQEFVAAQLNVLNAGGDGSPKVFYAMEGKLSCYNLKFDPVTLSNGFTISTETKLKDLFQQTRFSIYDSRTVDMPALARIFDLLNGNSNLANCNYYPPSAPVRAASGERLRAARGAERQ